MSDQDNAAGGHTNTDSAATTTATDATTGTTLLDGATAADAAATGTTNADGTTTGDATTKTDGTATDATKQDDKKQDDADTVPEAYADFTMPDGLELNAEVMGEFKTTAKELGLSQAKAQQVADLGAKLVQAAVAKQTEAIAAEQAKWETASRSDKEFGGDKLAENLGVAKTALDKFGSPELKQMLNQSGLGNHPEVIRLLHRVGKAVSEDTSSVRGGGVTTDQTAKSLYPNSNMN